LGHSTAQALASESCSAPASVTSTTPRAFGASRRSLIRKIAARKLRVGAISHSNFRRRGWNEAVKRAGLKGGPKITPHDARHAFASQMVELGLSSSDVSECLGHSTAGITERIYTHAFNREQREQRVRQAMAAAMAGGNS
jgi:integrase